MLKSRMTLLGATLLGAAILWITGYLSLYLIVLSLFLTYRIVNYSLVVRKSSQIFKYILSIVVLSVIGQVVILLSWLLNHEMPLSSSPYLILVTLLIIVVWREATLKKDRLTTNTKPTTLTRADAAAIALSLLIMFLITVGPVIKSIRQTGRISPASVSIDLINTSMDDSSHLSRLNDRIDLNRGVLYGSSLSKLAGYQNTISTYPAGWHSFNAVLLKAFIPTLNSGEGSLYGYVISKVFWMTVLLYCFFYLAMLAISLVDTKKLALAASGFIYALALFFAYYTMLEQFKEGFYNFIPVLIYLLASSILIIKSSDEPVAIHILVILFAGSILSWTLIAPGIFAAFLWYLTTHKLNFKVSEWRDLVKLLLGQIIQDAPLFIFISVSLLLQQYLLMASSSRSFSAGINDPGGITHHSAAFFIFVIIAGASYLLFGIRNKIVSILNTIPLVTGLLFCAFAIYAFQIITTGHTEYYFTKTLHTVVAILVPISLGALAILSRRILSKLGNKYATPLYFLIGILVLLTIGIEPTNTSNISYILGKRSFSSAENLAFTESLNNQASKIRDERTKVVLAYRRSDAGYNIIANNILRANRHVGHCDEMLRSKLVQNDVKGFMDTLIDCPPEKLELFTDDDEIQVLINKQTKLKTNITILKP